MAAAASGSIGFSKFMTPNETETIVIAAEADGSRLDRALAAQVPSLSRSRLKALILSGQVAVEGRTVSDPSIEVLLSAVAPISGRKVSAKNAAIGH